MKLNHNHILYILDPVPDETREIIKHEIIFCRHITDNALEQK
jgi:hypothetical protein